MNSDRDKHWQAYLDGELSATEAAEFEENLTPRDRERLAAEIRFESALGEALSQDANCPDDVWKRTRYLLMKQAAPNRHLRRWFMGAATLAAAASIAFVLMWLAPISPRPSPAVVMAAQTVEELLAASESGADRESVERFMKGCNIGLKLIDPSSLRLLDDEHPHVILVGARTELANGEPVAELLFDCCGKPVKVLVALRGSEAARCIGQAAGEGSQIQATRLVGDYLTAVVSDHPAFGLLDIFDRQSDTQKMSAL